MQSNAFGNQRCGAGGVSGHVPACPDSSQRDGVRDGQADDLGSTWDLVRVGLVVGLMTPLIGLAWLAVCLKIIF